MFKQVGYLGHYFFGEKCTYIESPTNFPVDPKINEKCLKLTTYDHFSLLEMISTILSEVFPSHSSGMLPSFQPPANNFSMAGLIAFGFVPNNSFVPIVIVSGRSVLSRSVMQ